MATHREVANNWFKQTGRKCNGFNVYYDGDTIYSYGTHFPIARHVTDSHGKPCILFTADSYSVSTAKHIGHVWSAMDYGGGIRVFRVPYVNLERNDGMTKEDRVHFSHCQNFASYFIRVNEDLEKWCNARSENRKAMYMRDMERLENEQAGYALAFGLEFEDKRRANVKREAA